MCVFCEIMSGRVRELPWAGRESVDEYRLSSEWGSNDGGWIPLGVVKGVVRRRPEMDRHYETKP
jgi:hypothetical protein